MSTTMRTPEVGTAPPVHRHLTTALWVVVGVLAAALVALGAWMVVDRYTGPEYDATTLIDDQANAWSSYDVDGVRAAYTDDAVLVSPYGDTITGMDELIGNVEAAKSSGLKIERIAPVTIEGDYATTFQRASAGAQEGTWVSVFQLQDGKILRQWDFAPGVTAPLDNAVIP
jgi:hypothetical protein